ncbi:hypothetical protein CCR82_04880, partial [Halochromatium salexigens]|nr:hypothetical protein [Halochromatium salexigens]
MLAAQALSVDLDLVASLVARRPRIKAVTLVGADIHAHRDAEGRIRIRGLEAMQGNDAQALAFFLREGRVRLLDSRVSWHDADTEAPAQTLFVEVAELVNQGRRHDLRVRARTTDVADNWVRIGARIRARTGAPIKALQLLAKLEGPAAHPERWSGRLYLKAEGGDLAPIASASMATNRRAADSFGLHTSDVQVKSWNRLEQGRLTESLATIGIAGLELEGDDARAALQLGNLSGLARWQRQAEGWRLDIRELRLPGSGASSPTSATLRYRRAPARDDAIPAAKPAPAARLFAAIGALPIGPLAEFGARVIPDLPEPVSALAEGRISGLARNLAVHLQLRPNPTDPGLPALADWRLKSTIDDLAISAGTQIPPFSGLDLDIDLSPTGGRARLGGRDTQLDLQPLFAQPHRFTALDGAFAWRLMPAGSIHLWTHALRAETAYLETLTRLSLCVHPSGANPFIDLHTHLRDGRIEALAQWLPVGIMDEGLTDWLLRAIVDAHLESGDLLLRGPLDRFPFDRQEGRFLLALRMVDGVLDYGGGAQPAAPQ